MTSSAAPGVTHRWTNLHAYADEVAAARIAAGFHYRFSTVVGQDMGRQIGTHTVKDHAAVTLTVSADQIRKQMKRLRAIGIQA